METRQTTQFFSSTFSSLFAGLWHSILCLKIVKIHLHVPPPPGLFWSVNYLNFGQKLLIQTAHHTFLESRHPEVTKNPYCFVTHEEPKKVSVHGLIAVYRGVYIHYFKIDSPNFCYLLFSKNYLNPQVRITKMVNKHTVDCHSSPSQLI